MEALMTDQRQKLMQHEAAFGQPLAHAKRVADLLRSRQGKPGEGFLTVFAYERAAEAHQLAASREAASRRYLGLPPE